MEKKIFSISQVDLGGMLESAQVQRQPRPCKGELHLVGLAQARWRELHGELG
jgi:hypothetical protein